MSGGRWLLLGGLAYLIGGVVPIALVALGVALTQGGWSIVGALLAALGSVWVVLSAWMLGSLLDRP